jgi:hypothetical protein
MSIIRTEFYARADKANVVIKLYIGCIDLHGVPYSP